MPRELKVSEGDSRGASEAPFAYNYCFLTYCKINNLDIDPVNLNNWCFQGFLAAKDPTFDVNCKTDSIGGDNDANRSKIPNIPIKCTEDEANTFFSGATLAKQSADGCTMEKPYPFPISDNLATSVPDDRFPGSLTGINVKIARANLQVWESDAELLLLCTHVKEMKDNNIKMRMKQKGYPGSPKLILKMLQAYCSDITVNWNDANIVRVRESDAFIGYHTTAVSTPGVMMKFLEDTGALGVSLIGETQVEEIGKAYKDRHSARAADKITDRSKMIAVAYRNAAGIALEDWHQGNHAVEEVNAVEYKKISDAFRIYFAAGTKTKNTNLLVSEEQGLLLLKSVASADAGEKDSASAELTDKNTVMALSENAGYDIRAGETIAGQELENVKKAIALEKDQVGMKRLVKAKKAHQIFEEELANLGKSYADLYFQKIVDFTTLILGSLQDYWRGISVAIILSLAIVFIARNVMALIFDTAVGTASTGVGVLATLKSLFSSGTEVV